MPKMWAPGKLAGTMLVGTTSGSIYKSNDMGDTDIRDVDAAYAVSNGWTYTGQAAWATAPTTVTATGSPMTWVNTTGGMVQLSISGGTVSNVQIKRLGTTYASGEATGGIVTLDPGDSAIITYSVAPTITALQM